MIKEETERLIKLHKAYVSNMEWHLKVNASFIKNEEKEVIEARILDQNTFISELQNLYKIYENEMAIIMARIDAVTATIGANEA